MVANQVGSMLAELGRAAASVMYPVITKVAIWTLAPEFERNLVVAAWPHVRQIAFCVFFQILWDAAWLVNFASVGRHIT